PPSPRAASSGAASPDTIGRRRSRGGPGTAGAVPTAGAAGSPSRRPAAGAAPSTSPATRVRGTGRFATCGEAWGLFGRRHRVAPEPLSRDPPEAHGGQGEERPLLRLGRPGDALLERRLRRVEPGLAGLHLAIEAVGARLRLAQRL